MNDDDDGSKWLIVLTVLSCIVNAVLLAFIWGGV